jgi:hypothetical protein
MNASVKISPKLQYKDDLALNSQESYSVDKCVSHLCGVGSEKEGVATPLAHQLVREENNIPLSYNTTTTLLKILRNSYSVEECVSHLCGVGSKEEGVATTGSSISTRGKLVWEQSLH